MLNIAEIYQAADAFYNHVDFEGNDLNVICGEKRALFRYKTSLADSRERNSEFNYYLNLDLLQFVKVNIDSACLVVSILMNRYIMGTPEVKFEDGSFVLYLYKKFRWDMKSENFHCKARRTGEISIYYEGELHNINEIARYSSPLKKLHKPFDMNDIFAVC